jgi:Fe-S oxidoreductase
MGAESPFEDSMNLEFEEKGTLTIDDDLWEELMDLTQGAIGPCFQCGVCTATCPWSLVKAETFSVRSLIRRAQVGLWEGLEDLWTCTTCAQCEASCPRGVPIAEVLRGLRYLLWKRRELMEGLPSILWSIHWNDNPWDQPPSQRSQWAKNRNLPLFDARKHEFLLYIGCTSSYDRRAQRIAHALVTVLQRADVSFGILGDDEPCCGEAALSLGHRPFFEEIAAKTSKLFLEKRVRQVITISPHCYDVFANHYPRLDNAFQPFHYTQFLARLLDTQGLDFTRTTDRKITFHDPCYLGRWNQEYDAPRQVLQAIPDLSLVEMERHGPDGLCCGGGGGRMWMETPVGERFSDLRVQEALSTGADTIATACPFCVTCLEDSIKAQHIHDLKVLDIAEIAASSISEG